MITYEIPMNGKPFSINSADVVQGQWNGRPYKGSHMSIKKSDPKSKQPKLVLTSPRAKVFNMEDEKDTKEYEELMSKAIHKQINVSIKELFTNRVPFSIYLEWYETYYTDPETAKNVK
jgi:hypothetical protein